MDGNLVLYQIVPTKRSLWHTETYGKGATQVFMQGDGNLVVYTEDSTVLWSSSTNNNPGANLSLNDDGNLVIYHDSQSKWSSKTLQQKLSNPFTGDMNKGDFIISQSELYMLKLQENGNLVLYQIVPTNLSLWKSGTDNVGVIKASMQSDGNLVLYKEDGTAPWSSSTSNNPGALLSLNDDGNLGIYQNGQSVWVTNTAPLVSSLNSP